MAPPPTGEDSAANFDTPRSLPTPFLSKTYQLVDDHSIDDVISWNEDGSTFVVWNPTEFAKDLLPKCFKHNNFSSFVRQLNTYGFRKIVPDRWEFYNEFFRRGEKRLLCDIQRRKMATSASPAAIPVTVAAAVPAPQPLRTVSPTDSGEEQVISSNSSPAANRETNCETNAELIDENERLKKENIQLNKELSQVKSLCNNIYVLMSNYANNNQPAIKQLDLLPAAKRSETTSERDENRTGSEGNVSPRLFGFPIGVKRPRKVRVNRRIMTTSCTCSSLEPRSNLSRLMSIARKHIG